MVGAQGQQQFWNETIHSLGERTTVKEIEGLTLVFEELIKSFN